MKVYIHNFNLLIGINDIQNVLSDLLTSKEKYMEIYTNESMYHVNSRNIYLLETNDRETIVYNNFIRGITLVVDHSNFIKKLETSIHGNEHIHNTITKYTYKLNSRSKLSFVVEINHNNLEETLNDVYFECNEIVDIKELFIKQEISEFLSLLN